MEGDSMPAPPTPRPGGSPRILVAVDESDGAEAVSAARAGAASLPLPSFHPPAVSLALLPLFLPPLHFLTSPISAFPSSSDTRSVAFRYALTLLRRSDNIYVLHVLDPRTLSLRGECLTGGYGECGGAVYVAELPTLA
ncbi:unnamed protein product [Closterium sp. NIES-64]|nr:unnamed protein product [Closterium sp. NIES-64]